MPPSIISIQPTLFLVLTRQEKKLLLTPFLMTWKSLKETTGSGSSFLILLIAADVKETCGYFFTDYLDTFGTMLDGSQSTGAGAYLYDLNP